MVSDAFHHSKVISDSKLSMDTSFLDLVFGLKFIHIKCNNWYLLNDYLCKKGRLQVLLHAAYIRFRLLLTGLLYVRDDRNNVILYFMRIYYRL